MSDPLITVIVPVYKAELSLERCVRSIQNQTHSNLEIILVNDGSPDNCGQMCDRYAEKDSRIKVIHKENGGQSSARNAGMEAMSGEYLTFVDSDDWIEPDYYKTILSLMQENDAQIGVCGLQCDYLDGKKVWFNSQYPHRQEIEKMSTEDALRENTYAEKITNSPCDKLFERKIFEGIQMRERAAFEDFEIMAQCLSRATCIVYNPYPFYHYIMTEKSVTRGDLSEKHFLEMQIAKNRISFYEKEYPQLAMYAVGNQVNIGLTLFYKATGSKVFKKQRLEIKKELRKIARRNVFRILRKNDKIKYFVFLLWPWLYIQLMNLYGYAKEIKEYAPK